ncbi:S-layer homology domain-containing protein [Lysinibacillus sp. NPDC093190]|uniref:S-layer homology domain-containing protein n=1 Tax=Lysinibacillus sp. NPDC093190 TaxID=3390575 RepID=UPI003CFC6C04
MFKEIAKRCIIKGYPDGTFRPNDLAQRQHVVLMIDRALQPTLIRDAVSFSDVPKSMYIMNKLHDCNEQVSWMVQTELSKCIYNTCSNGKNDGACIWLNARRQ